MIIFFFNIANRANVFFFFNSFNIRIKFNLIQIPKKAIDVEMAMATTQESRNQSLKLERTNIFIDDEMMVGFKESFEKCF